MVKTLRPSNDRDKSKKLLKEEMRGDCEWLFAANEFAFEYSLPLRIGR